ncbi:MAG: VOC family protein [Solirubrobacterales bacterium]
MPTNIYVSYPTADLEASKAFYTALGAEINPLMSDDNGTCFVWDENIYLMVLKREFMAQFTDKQLADPAETAQVQVAFSRESREEVDAVTEAGLKAGGTEPRPAEDLGFMYSRDLEDPDGNIVAFMWFSEQAHQQGPEAHMAQQEA